jgi:hypothetical protein
VRPKPTPKPKPVPSPVVVPNSQVRGNASMLGLVSFFRSETGEIKYLSGVSLYVSSQPLDGSLTSATRKVTAAELPALRRAHAGALSGLSRRGAIVAQGTTDRFGRFQIHNLPEGRYYLIAVTDGFGHYLVWQRPVSLDDGRQFRVYLNRNNLSMLSI